MKNNPDNRPDNPETLPIDMRLTGTTEDLNKWSWFLGLIEEKGMITILEKSRIYNNYGSSKLFRQYIKIKLNRG